jgi:hypothetical protein
VARGESAEAGERVRGTTLERHLVEKENGPQFSHPLGLPLLAAPVVYVGMRVFGLPSPDIALGFLVALVAWLGLGACVELSTRTIGSRTRALVFCCAFLVSTPLWFYCRTFFTEIVVCGLLGVACLLLSRGWALAAGLVLGTCVVVREPSIVLVASVIFGALALRGLGAGAKAAIGTVLGVGVTLLRNHFINGGGVLDFPQPFRYGSLVEGTAGLLGDPVHGALLFAPVIVLTPFGVMFSRNRAERVVCVTSMAGAVTYFAIAASWIDWRGGSCFGPRLIVPSLFLAGYPLLLLFARGGTRLRVVACLLLGLGSAIEVIAIAHPFRAFWGIDIREIVAGNLGRLAFFLGGGVSIGWLYFYLAFTRKPEGTVNLTSTVESSRS